MDSLVSFEYTVEIQNRALTNIANRVTLGVKDQMQAVLDALVANIKGQFTDNDLAETVTSFIQAGGIPGSDDYTIEGVVTSTWANMIWYELGRPPGGKMPPQDALLAYIAKHNIIPDPEKAKIAFAYAINVVRQRKDKKAVPIDVLVEWQNKAGITVPEDFANKSLAFAIGKKIVREGIDGHHYFAIGLENTMDLINTSFEDVVISATGLR